MSAHTAPAVWLRSHVRGGSSTEIVETVEVTSARSAGAFRATAFWAPPAPLDGAGLRLPRRRAYGRGRTAYEAACGAIGEALERYSLVYRGDERLIRAKFSEIDAIHPHDVLLFSDAQYATRHAWNATADELFHVPEPFSCDVAVDWLEAQPLGRAHAPKYVAAAICLMWYELRHGQPELACADTIGCAGGETFDAALSGALLEWIERDAMAIWWDNRLRRPGVAIESLVCPDLDNVIQGLRAVGRDLFLLDCTTDIGIPAYVAVAPRFDGSEPLFAGAAHVSPSVAAYRAASEVGQVWYDVKRSGRLSSAFGSWLLRTNVSDHPHLMPAGTCEAQQAPPADRRRNWEPIVERLESVGLTAYAVDHSRPEVCTRTVRAVVPGLRHIWNRRAPGRLYDVPIKMGWLAEPTAEQDLNPVRCMI
jgi:oxazoline/thiazoline synthase